MISFFQEALLCIVGSRAGWRGMDVCAEEYFNETLNSPQIQRLFPLSTELLNSFCASISVSPSPHSFFPLDAFFTVWNWSVTQEMSCIDWLVASGLGGEACDYLRHSLLNALVTGHLSPKQWGSLCSYGNSIPGIGMSDPPGSGFPSYDLKACGCDLCGIRLCVSHCFLVGVWWCLWPM